MASRTDQGGTKDSSSRKPMSDMDPEGMDSEFEGDADLDASEETTDPDRRRGQQTQQASTKDSHDKADEHRSRQVDSPEDGEAEDEEDQDMEPRSTPRSASHQPEHNRRESDRPRPSQPGDRRR
jgi:hypothetical protein